MDKTVDRPDRDGKDGRPEAHDLRLRVPRGKLRHDRHSCRLAQRRAGSPKEISVSALVRQWFSSAHLRNRLVSAAGTCHRCLDGFGCCHSCHVHGWDVSRELDLYPTCFDQMESVTYVRRHRTRYRSFWPVRVASAADPGWNLHVLGLGWYQG